LDDFQNALMRYHIYKLKIDLDFISLILAEFK
jgi:hypothetical protein